MDFKQTFFLLGCIVPVSTRASACSEISDLGWVWFGHATKLTPRQSGEYNRLLKALAAEVVLLKLFTTITFAMTIRIIALCSDYDDLKSMPLAN